MKPHIGFASDKFEKILGAGHAQQETYWVGGLPPTLYSFCNRVQFSSGAIKDPTLW